MRVTLREFGGLAGLRGRPRASIDTNALPAEHAVELTHLLEGARKWNEVPSPQAPGADGLGYDVLIESAGEVSSIALPPNGVDAACDKLRRRLVELAMQPK